MGFFDKPTEQESRQKLESAIASMEAKVRTKAAAKGFEVSAALYVLEAFIPKEEETSAFSRPFVSIFADRVVQNRKSFFNSSNEEIPLGRISSVEITTGLIPSVHVYTSGNTLSFRTDSLQGPRFVEILRSQINTQKSRPESGASSDVEQLEKLSALFDKGHLTKSEFEQKKKQILGL